MAEARARARGSRARMEPELPYALLARVRRSLRALNAAIERGASLADLTVQQQAFMLVIAAQGGQRVRLSLIRGELGMDQATASELLARLVSLRLVRTDPAADRRALELSLTRKGRERFLRSVDGIRHAVQTADRAGELRALRESLAAYLDHYTGARGARRGIGAQGRR